MHLNRLFRGKGVPYTDMQHLEKTSWRLMSDGVTYRLGMMSGRIRIYEDQDDLAKLIESKHG
jgi:hypothetical protein